MILATNLGLEHRRPASSSTVESRSNGSSKLSAQEYHENLQTALVRTSADSCRSPDASGGEAATRSSWQPSKVVPELGPKTPKTGARKTPKTQKTLKTPTVRRRQASSGVVRRRQALSGVVRRHRCARPVKSCLRLLCLYEAELVPNQPAFTR